MFSAWRRHASRTVLVVPTDAEVERMTADARFFSGRSRRSVQEPTSSDCFFLSVARGRSLSRTEAALSTLPSARARALHATATGAARLIVRVRGGASAAPLAPDVLKRAAATLTPGLEMAPPPRASSSSRRATPARSGGRVGRVLRCAAARRRLLSGRRRRAPFA